VTLDIIKDEVASLVVINHSEDETKTSMEIDLQVTKIDLPEEIVDPSEK
jgi:hypothetical protein